MKFVSKIPIPNFINIRSVISGMKQVTGQ